MLSTVFLLTQSKISVPSVITGTYEVSKQVNISNQSIVLKGTSDKPAILAITSRDSVIQNCKISLQGDATIVFYQAHGSRMENCAVVGGTGNQLRIIRSSNFTLSGSKFYGNGNLASLVVASPGHPWQFSDAGNFGFNYSPSSRFQGGTNLIGHYNPLNAERSGYYNGSRTITIPLTAAYCTFNPFAGDTDVRWMLWQNGDLLEAKQVSISGTSVTLSAPAGLRAGQFRWQSYRPSQLTPGLKVKNSSFINITPRSGKEAGFVGFGQSGAVLEGNYATGFDDYGIGLEFSSDCSMIGNTAEMNQVYERNGVLQSWNDLEIVASFGPMTLRGNTGNQAEVRHYYYPAQVITDRAFRVQLPSGYKDLPEPTAAQ